MQTASLKHGSILGMQIHVTPDWPKMQLSEDCPVTPEYRVEINLWLREFFGYTNLLEDGRVYAVDDMVCVNPRTFRQLKAIL